jgi:hypothetical protein
MASDANHNFEECSNEQANSGMYRFIRVADGRERGVAGSSFSRGRVDIKAEKEMSGTVTSIKFSNRHGSLAVIKNADGSTTEWVMTLGSGSALAQRGVDKTGLNALHAGDDITVKFLPARNGSPLGFLKTVIMPDGRVIQISAGNPND